jgi:quercetin dioxygenase-like cupin family protein
MATRSLATINMAYVPIGKPESILRSDLREISLLFANEALSLTYASRPAGERVTDLHTHGHAEAFYVLEGALAFEVGAEHRAVTIEAGGFVAVPAGVAHSYGTAGSHRARWLVIHAVEGGFAAFMRGMRDGVEVEWDIAPVPLDGGLPADHTIVSRPRSAHSPSLAAAPSLSRREKLGHRPRAAREPSDSVQSAASIPL